MTQQALHEAQARLDQLQKQYDAAYSALEAEPSSDLRFVVKTLTGKLQVVVVQCKKVGAGTEQRRDRTASIHDIQHHLTQLRACFDR